MNKPQTDHFQAANIEAARIIAAAYMKYPGNLVHEWVRLVLFEPENVGYQIRRSCSAE